MTREVLQQALESLEGVVYAEHNVQPVIAAIKEALAQPDQNLACKSTQARLAASWGYVKAQPDQENSLPSLKDLKRSIRHRAKTEGYPCHFCGKHFCNHGCLKD